MVRYIHHQASNIRSVATDYFTEAIPLKNVKKEIFIKVLKENLIHIFGISLTVTADQEKVFTGEQVKEFAIMLLRSFIQHLTILRLMVRPSHLIRFLKP